MTREQEQRRGSGDAEGPTAESVAAGKRARTDGLVVQRRGAASGGGLPFMDVMLQSDQVQATALEGVAAGGGAMPHLDRIQASFGAEHDVSQVQASVGGTAGHAAARIGAEAYATGDRVAFQRTPDLHTAAHEAAHVVQQRAGVQIEGGVGRDGDAYERQADAVADRVVSGASSADLLGTASGTGGGAGAPVQMRRVLDDPALLFDPADPTQAGANSKAHSDGLSTLIARARKELTADEVTAFEADMLGGMDAKDFFALPRHEILARMSKSIAKIRPDLAFGDPKLIDSGARSGTSDKDNIQKLIDNANEIFNPIIAGTHDTDLAQVFGRRKVGKAKDKYKQAKKWMLKLQRRDKVVADRSGYYDEASIGGLTGTHRQLALGPDKIDNPDAHESIITMIHEALHAGNGDVDDKSYVSEGNFTEEATTTKLQNAAHFEVVPRRILLREALVTDSTATDAAAFAGETFIPAGSTVGGVTKPPLTDAEKAIKAASFKLRESWDRGINLHRFFVESHKAPTHWTRDSGGYKHKNFLPYWSKVEKLTVHEKTDIDPASSDPAKQPVSQIDCALSEGLIRKFGNAYDAMPTKESELTAFEAVHSTEDERTAAHASVDAHRDFLIKLCLGLDEVKPITGSVDRDFRVVERLNIPFGDIFRRRSPDDFAD